VASAVAQRNVERSGALAVRGYDHVDSGARGFEMHPYCLQHDVTVARDIPLEAFNGDIPEA
jgi:hypothetical protein